jgi:hypothetical protein
MTIHKGHLKSNIVNIGLLSPDGPSDVCWAQPWHHQEQNKGPNKNKTQAVIM